MKKIPTDKIVRIVCAVWLLLACGCSNDLETLSQGNALEGLPVQFTAEYPEEVFPHSRVGKPLPEDKEGFAVGDVIQVSATFYSDANAQGTVLGTQYAPLTLTEKDGWVAKTELLGIKWPWNSKSAKFHAYYFSDWDGAFAGDELHPNVDVTKGPVSLNRFSTGAETFNPDPLEATSEVVEYGHAVNLKFEHCCTRLTIVGVDDADEYGLKYKTGTLNDAFRLTRYRDNTLKLEFVPKSEENQKVIAPVYEIKEDGEKKGQKAVTFHLAPGNYNTFSLVRRNDYGYITISNVTKLDATKPNYAYRLSIKDLMGNITQDDNDDGWWGGGDEFIPTYEDFSVENFMKAIAESKPYICNQIVEGKDPIPVTLLEKDPYLQSVKLTRNVDFMGITCPSVDLGDFASFDGGNHIIAGVSHTLFKNLNGRVSNLRLQNAGIKVENQTEYNKGLLDGQYTWGVLARECRGTVENVSLTNGALDIKVHGGSDQTHNIGLLIGRTRTGSKLSNITLEGNLSVNVTSAYDDKVLYVTCIGGVIGQCSDGELDHFDIVSPITITNSCKGYSSRMTGGVVGRLSQGTVSNGTVNAVVDASGAVGSLNYTGGVAGTVRTNDTSEAEAIVDNVMVSGTVIGGEVYAIPKIGGGKQNDAHSATGGIAGYVQHSQVVNCTAANRISIQKYSEHIAGHEFYSIGGCLGTIESANTVIKGNKGLLPFNATQYNNSPAYYHAGRFAGVGNGTELEKSNSAEPDNNGSPFIGINGSQKNETR